MPWNFEISKKAGFVLLAVVLSLPASGQEKTKPASLIGISKDQVYTILGEPRSQMKAGTREVMFFPKLKVTLRNNVVIETEPMFDDVAPKRPVEPAQSAAPTSAVAQSEADVAKPSKSGQAQGASAPADADTSAKSGTPAVEAKPSAPAESPGGLEIKLVRTPAKSQPRPSPKSISTQSPPPAAVTVAPVAGVPVPTARSVATSAAPAQTSVPVAVTAPVEAAAGTTRVAEVHSPQAPAAKETSSTAPVEPTEVAGESEATPQPKPKVVPKRFFRRSADHETELPVVSLFSAQTYLLGAGVIGAVAYLIWRRRQTKLDLEASSVSNTPFQEPSAVDTAAMFTAEFLGKLEWKHFEELVAAYYVKTGVVAVRTKTGPESPVHLNISWKGEAKPFACVQCHASPTGLIRIAPLQALHSALTAADIRRGYVVTNGKFNVEARDFAEEKHFTLLPGDLLLEKLNALPPAARIELMQETSASDYSTPTCPKCDVSMVRGDGGGWRCVNRPKCDVTIAAGGV
jgi:hypothetical protein